MEIPSFFMWMDWPSTLSSQISRQINFQWGSEIEPCKLIFAMYFPKMLFKAENEMGHKKFLIAIPIFQNWGQLLQNLFMYVTEFRYQVNFWILHMYWEGEEGGSFPVLLISNNFKNNFSSSWNCPTWIEKKGL